MLQTVPAELVREKPAGDGQGEGGLRPTVSTIVSHGHTPHAVWIWTFEEMCGSDVLNGFDFEFAGYFFAFFE